MSVLAEQTGEQRYEGDADEGNATASHKLLHTLGLCTGVVVTVTFEQVNDTPNTETGTQSDYEGLKNANCRSKKCHINFLLEIENGLVILSQSVFGLLICYAVSDASTS